MAASSATRRRPAAEQDRDAPGHFARREHRALRMDRALQLPIAVVACRAAPRPRAELRRRRHAFGLEVLGRPYLVEVIA